MLNVLVLVRMEVNWRIKVKVIVLSTRTRTPQPSVLESASGDGVDWKLNVEDLNEQEIEREKRDNSKLVALPMPLRLVHPVPFDKSETPDETDKKFCWGLDAIGVTSCPYTGAGVTIAILDTGIERQHRAFEGVDIVEKDFTGEGNGDWSGHGTHCAGTAFGRPSLELGCGIRFGVAPGIKRALIGKVIGTNGASTDNVCAALAWATENAAQVVSMSLGIDFPGYAKFLQDAHHFPPELAISKALTAYRDNIRVFDKMAELIRAKDTLGKGAIVIAAAGNESRRDLRPDFRIALSPPAAAVDVMAVGAVRKTKHSARPYEIARFSNSGATVVAPGVAVLSAQRGGGLSYESGTSMAAPHVAGAAALWIERELTRSGRFRAELIVHRLTGNAELTAGLDPADVGAGLIRVPTGDRDSSDLPWPFS